MGTLPFLIILSVFGVVLFWYVRREETGSDGSQGLLGLGRKAEAEEENEDGDEELSPREKIRRLSKKS